MMAPSPRGGNKSVHITDCEVPICPTSTTYCSAIEICTYFHSDLWNNL